MYTQQTYNHLIVEMYTQRYLLQFHLGSFIFKVHEINWVSATGNRRQTDSISVSLETYCESCIRTYHGSTR